jgi:hypothetical protein
MQLEQGYFLEYRTNIAPKVPYKAEEKGLFAWILASNRTKIKQK